MVLKELRKLQKNLKHNEENARKLCKQRNDFRKKARDMMNDQKAREKLDKDSPIRDFDYYKNKYQERGHKGEDLWRKIMEQSGKSNKDVNPKHGL